jgi:hypothetical protein
MQAGPGWQGVSEQCWNLVRMSTPPGIVLSRHLDLEGRWWPLYFRRGVLTLLTLIVLAALLNEFGQQTAVSSARSPRAALTVASPERVRGGLMFTTRFTIEAPRMLAHPKLVLDSGWLAGMQVNSIVPQPKDETSVHGRAAFTFEAIPAGGRQNYYVGFQVDPTTLGRQRQVVRLLDGNETILTVRRTLTVLP